MKTEVVTKALGDLTRLRILRLLGHMELAVGELAHVLGQSQPRVSRHIAILCESSLVERRREGSWTFLRQTATADGDRGINVAVARLLEAAEQDDAAFAARCSEDRRHLAAIRKGREISAAEYFARHADDWDRLRALLTPAEEIESALIDALGPGPLGKVLDIGTGTGRVVELVLPLSERVVGVDRSPEMLRLARARLQNLPGDKWELAQGDFVALPFEPATFDTVVFHQVLHFASDPALPLAEAARVCRSGGRIAVVDLAAHEHEDLRERHAHVRLGFTDEQMMGWLVASGFIPAPPLALPGNALTAKIWVARSGHPTSMTSASASETIHA